MKYWLFLIFLIPLSLSSQHALNLTYSQGSNVKSFNQFSALYNFQYTDSVSKNTFESNISFDYGSQDQIVNSRDFSIALRERLYWGPIEGFMNLQNDQSLARGIDNRIMGGVGLEKQLIKKGGLSVSVSDGGLFELTKFTTRGEFSKVRNSFRLQIKNKGKVKFKSNLMLQHNVKDFSDYIVISNTTLGMPLSKMIDFTARYSYIQETFVNKSTDFLTFGLEVNF